VADEIKRYWPSAPFPFLQKKWDEADMKKVERGRKAEQRSKTHCWAQKDGVSSEVVKHCTFFKFPLPLKPRNRQ
jgi:hypothetical protein